MKIVYTDHARERIKERLIRLADIRAVLMRPDRSERVYEDKVMSRKNIRGRVIEVVFIQKKSITVIITAYYL